MRILQGFDFQRVVFPGSGRPHSVLIEQLGTVAQMWLATRLLAQQAQNVNVSAHIYYI